MTVCLFVPLSYDVIAVVTITKRFITRVLKRRMVMMRRSKKRRRTRTMEMMRWRKRMVMIRR